jgi:hypothetical protein
MTKRQTGHDGRVSGSKGRTGKSTATGRGESTRTPKRATAPPSTPAVEKDDPRQAIEEGDPQITGVDARRRQ